MTWPSLGIRAQDAATYLSHFSHQTVRLVANGKALILYPSET